MQIPLATIISGFSAKDRNQLLAHDQDDGTVTKLRALKLDSLIFNEHDRRVYPNNELAAHVLGFTGADGHGLVGMEKEMDNLLSGTPGERQVERDAKKHEIAVYQDHEVPAIRRRQCNFDHQNGDSACGGRSTRPDRADLHAECRLHHRDGPADGRGPGHGLAAQLRPE